MNMKPSRYLVFLLGGVWGCFLSSLVTEKIHWMLIGLVIGAFASAFAMVCCESIMLLDSKAHEKYDEKYPNKDSNNT